MEYYSTDSETFKLPVRVRAVSVSIFRYRGLVPEKPHRSQGTVQPSVTADLPAMRMPPNCRLQGRRRRRPPAGGGLIASSMTIKGARRASESRLIQSRINMPKSKSKSKSEQAQVQGEVVTGHKGVTALKRKLKRWSAAKAIAQHPTRHSAR